MQTIVPPTPSIEATRRAWPPAPKVQSTATWPGSGASSSTSSVARTGLCSIGITPTMAAPLCGLPWSYRDVRPALSRTSSARPARARVSLGVGISIRSPVARQALGDLGRRGVELFLLLGPSLGVPDLQVLAGAD